MGASMNTESVDFTGGMDTIKAAHLIAKSEARLLVNVDIRNGSLQSMPNLVFESEATDRFFVEFKDNLLFYNRARTNTFFDNKLYWADGVDTGKVLEDGTELALGLPTPLNAPIIAPVVVIDGPHLGDFKYCYTFYSTTTGVESAPSPLTPYLTVDKDEITVSSLDLLPTEADNYRIYRIGGYLSLFTMVAQIELADIPYLDNLDDTEIDGRILQTLHTGEPLSGLNDFIELGGRLFGSRGSRVYFSALGNPDAWYISDFLVMPDDITAMAKSPAGLLVFGKTFTYLLAGQSPLTFRLKVISNYIGCISRESVAYIRDKAVWLSINGVCTSTGYGIVNLTADRINNLSSIVPTSACVVNEVYYCHYLPVTSPTEELFPSDDLFPAGSLANDGLSSGIINMDFKRGSGYSFGIYQYENVTSIGVHRGDLYTVTTIPNVTFLACDEPLACDGFIQCNANDLSLVNRIVDSDFTQLSYISPQFIDGSISTLKQYEKVRINLRGRFNVKVLFNTGNVIVEEDIQSAPNVGKAINLLSGISVIANPDETVTIGIPNANNLSYSIGFIITGVGVINSIQYSWKPRELP